MTWKLKALTLYAMPKSQEECVALLEQIRWAGCPRCPYCQSTVSARLKRERRHHCNECFTSYSVTVGTLFHGTRVELLRWFQAIRLVLNSPNPPSVRQLAAQVGVSKNTAASMLHRLKKATIDESDLLNQLLDVLEKKEG